MTTYKSAIDQDKPTGISCPRCDFATRVTDSREGPNNSTRRRRCCLSSACGHRFTTYEVAIGSLPISQTMLDVMVADALEAHATMGKQLQLLTTAVAASRVLTDLEQK